MTSAWHPARWPASVAVPIAWATYVLLLVATLPFSPLGVLWMLGPLLVTGWYAKDWIIPAVVGLGHGVLLAAVTIWLGVFPLALTDPALALAAGLMVILSWFTTIAGRTIRLVSVVRQQYDHLSRTELELEENAASVEAIWEATSVALIALDSRANIISWNPGAEEVFKRSAASMQNKSVTSLAAANDPDDCMAPIMYALETQRRTPPFEGRLLNGHGQLLDVEVRARPVTHPGGDKGLILTVVDRTREYLMEDILEEQAERQDRLLQNLEEVLYSVEVPSRRTAMLTKTVETLTGHSIAAFGDFQDFLALAHPDDRQAVAERWEHARSGEKSTLRWRVCTAAGNHVWVEDRVVPVRNEEGRVVRLDGIVRRIFREIELERQAQRMTRWLDALEPLAGTGAWSVDLRTGEWTWSRGMAEFLHSDQYEYENWARCVTREDLPILESLVDHPDSFASPQRLRMIDGSGRQRPYIIEAWLQRGNDGEPIHLYGVLRPEAAEQPTARPTATAPTRRTVRGRPVATPLPREAVEKVWRQEADVAAGRPGLEEAAAAQPFAAKAESEELLAHARDEAAPHEAMVGFDEAPEAFGPDAADWPAEAAPEEIFEPGDTADPNEAPVEAEAEPLDEEPTTAPSEGEPEAEAAPWADEFPEAEPELATEAFMDPRFDEGPEDTPASDTGRQGADAMAPKPTQAARASLHAIETEEPTADVEAVEWDDDIGWVPKMKPKPLVPQTGKDEAEEVTAKQWPAEDKPKPKGPWSLD